MVLRLLPHRQSFFRQISRARTCKRPKSTAADAAAAAAAAAAPVSRTARAGRDAPVDLTSLYTSKSRTEKQKKSQERDFLVSVLASSPTKRDAKLYLQTFGSGTGSRSPSGAAVAGSGLLDAQRPPPVPLPGLTAGIRSVQDSPQFVQGAGRATAATVAADGVPHVAIVKLHDPLAIDAATLDGLAKTFVQLRALGLASVVVLSGVGASAGPREGAAGWLEATTRAGLRVVEAFDHYGPVASLVDASVCWDDKAAAATAAPSGGLSPSPFVPGAVYVDRAEALMRPLRRGDIVVLPPYAFSPAASAVRPVDADDLVLALTRFFTGVQGASAASRASSDALHAAADPASSDAAPLASVDRVIVIDPIGGTPSPRRPNGGAHIFLNLEQEYRPARALLLDAGDAATAAVRRRHVANLDVVRNALALLPSSSSALLTTPAEAANLGEAADAASGGTGTVASAGSSSTTTAATSLDADTDIFGVVGSVGTRRRQNPLIHNLLTDRPVFSSSLPLGRIKPAAAAATVAAPAGAAGERLAGTTTPMAGSPAATPAPAAPPRTTLVKRGLPLTIFPDPRVQPWTPPAPGQAPRLRLTDACIDLPRLVHLIEDSFGRRLDVDHYLQRVERSLAGVIVAGEYEGGAILTWEAGAADRHAPVPYLDKFAVLRKSQGAGGVADIVFTAMVRDCFPDGVCWRSRKDNPVNRWYFERSRGSWKLGGVNWTMFWTTPWAALGGEARIWDYEAACRRVEPSWADDKHILD